jgi:hypothetical protein
VLQNILGSLSTMERTAGSLIEISIGFITASKAIFPNVMPFRSISVWDLILSLPLTFRRRAARRKRIFEAEVSGRQKKKRMKTGPAAQSISQSDHRQLRKCISRVWTIQVKNTYSLATTANPESIGPRAGAAKDADTQNATE